jgi:hypothetical protein
MELTELEKIKKFFKCKFCNETYSNPIVLSCGDKICEKDLDKIEHKSNENSELQIKCPLCEDIMLLPEKKFPYDKSLKELILDIVDVDFDFSDDYLVVKDNLKYIDLMIKHLETLNEDPNNYTYEYFLNLKNKVDIEKEKCLLFINDHFSRLIEQIKEYENKCKIEARKNKENNDMNIKNMKELYTNLKMNLNKLTIGNNLEDLLFETEFLNLKLKKLTRDLKNCLILNKTYDLKVKKLNSEYFSCLINEKVLNYIYFFIHFLIFFFKY